MSLDSATIAEKLGVPSQHVETLWPLIVAALVEFGIDSPLVQVAAAATCAVETGRFWPLQEIHASQERQPDLWATQERYWPSGYYGRGIVMTTWQENYQALQDATGIPCVEQPDLLLEPEHAARALAFFFKTHRDGEIVVRANNQDWPGVRRGVNGGTYALEQFLKDVDALVGAANG